MNSRITKSELAKRDAAAMSRIIFVYNFDEVAECSICMASVQGKSAKVTPCGHVFHSKCLRGWTDMKSKDTCPNCRSALGTSLEVVPPLDPMDVFVTSMLARVMSTPSTYRMLPSPPFSLPSVLTNPTVFHIESNVGLHTDALSEIVNWVSYFGVRVTNIDDVVDVSSEGVSVRQVGERRPGTMEILYSRDPIVENRVHLFAVAIASLSGSGDCVAWHPTPAGANMPLATILPADGQLNASLIQAACFLIACETNVVMELITSGSALGFGNPAEQIGYYIDSIVENINIDFGGVRLVSQAQSFFYVPPSDALEGESSELEEGPDSP